MQTRDRPQVEWLAILIAGALVVLEPFVFFSWSIHSLIVAAIAAVTAIAMVVLIVVLTKRHFQPMFDDARGAAALLLALLALAVTIHYVMQPRIEGWLWAQFVVMFVVAALALLLSAVEWSQRWLVALAIVLLTLIGASLVRVGYRAERAAAFTDPITAAIDEKPKLDAEGAKGALEKNIALAQKSNDATSELAHALPSASTPFNALGLEILTELTAPPTTVPSPEPHPTKAERLNAATARVLALPVSTELAAQDVRVRDAAPAAVDAFDAKVAGAPTPSSKGLDAAIDTACTAAKNSHVAIKGCEGRAAGAAADDSNAGAIHDLEVELANYRAAVNPDDKALAEKAKAAAASKPPELERSFVDAAAAGSDEILSSLNNGRPLGFVPGPIGWAVAALLLLVAMRQLIRLNALQMPGPVKINRTDDDSAPLRIAILKNLKTPAAAPGSSVAQSITDLTAVGGVEAGVVGKVVTALLSVLTINRGYEVDAEVSKPKAESKAADKDKSTDDDKADAADATSVEEPATTVLVRVSAAGSQESLASQSFSDAAPDKAMRAAGLWAAGFLLGRSTRIPSWACWTEDTAKSLGATLSESPALDELQAAARTAPTSGWILQLYGNELELAGRELDAAAVYARAVVAHPRYLIARYRLAAALGMLARDKATPWNTNPYADRSALTKLLVAVSQRLNVGSDPASSLGTPATETQLEAFAALLLATIDEDTGKVRYNLAKLRRAERDRLWFAPRRRSRSRENTQWLAKSCRLLYVTPTQAEINEVEREARKPSSSWQLSYNLACMYANTPAAPQETALDWLERCLLRPGIHELNAKWVQQDIDLKPVRNLPRFARFCDQLEQESDA